MATFLRLTTDSVSINCSHISKLEVKEDPNYLGWFDVDVSLVGGEHPHNLTGFVGEDAQEKAGDFMLQVEGFIRELSTTGGVITVDRLERTATAELTVGKLTHQL